MHCCCNCFVDPEIKAFISSFAERQGDCDFCGERETAVYELSPASELSDRFEPLLRVFLPSKKCTEQLADLPETAGFVESFCHTWSVFSFADADKINLYFRQLYGEDSLWLEELLSDSVIPESVYRKGDFISRRLFGGKDWEYFADSIRNKSRFHSGTLNTEILDQFLELIKKDFSPDDKFYRARVWNKAHEPSLEDLDMPKKPSNGGGRMNAEGIPCLYLAESPETAIREVRASLFDRVAVVEATPKAGFSVVCLDGIDTISPFLEELDCSNLAANIYDLRKIREELMRPMRTSDSALEYLPTQYISDYIMGVGNAGIGYKSVMRKGGYNFASRQALSGHFDCQSVAIYDISDIEYEHSEVCRYQL